MSVSSITPQPNGTVGLPDAIPKAPVSPVPTGTVGVPDTTTTTPPVTTTTIGTAGTVVNTSA